jgi:phosphotransferase system enzyme I (PtsI)
MRKGIAVSPGVAVGTAYCIDEVYVAPGKRHIAEGEVAEELSRYDRALEATARDLAALQEKVARQVGPTEAAIFAAHANILRDTAFTHRVRQWIATERLSCQAALHQLLQEYTDLFQRIHDDYMRERLNDVRDVVIRLSAHLSDVLQPESKALSGPLIVIANELLPSQAVTLGKIEVRGIVTQAGSQTSHAAIIARSRGIPAVSGVAGILRHVRTGDTVVVDGTHGHVLVNPDAELLAAYRKLEREFQGLHQRFAANREQIAATRDGTVLELLANVNILDDAVAAQRMGATGVGLYRTEYLYLMHPSIPNEEEQLEAYCRIIDAAPGHRVTLRTLDIGGDKTVAYLGHQHQEANPFLGWRSIRLSFEHPELFSTQIRAALRAAAYAQSRGGQLRLLFPMVTTLEELRKIRRILYRASQQLADRRIAHGRLCYGMMLEVPAAALCLDLMLEAVDFVSIGSNDLVQYLMAADRDNPKVSHLYQPLAPAVLRTLHSAISACQKAGKPVTLCGEMAAQPRAFLLLVGMGLRSFSMSPAFIPSIKELAQQVTTSQCQAWLQHCMRLRTTAHIRRYMTQQIRKVAERFDLLDTT